MSIPLILTNYLSGDAQESEYIHGRYYINMQDVGELIYRMQRDGFAGVADTNTRQYVCLTVEVIPENYGRPNIYVGNVGVPFINDMPNDTVHLALEGEIYDMHGEFRIGDGPKSVSFTELALDALARAISGSVAKRVAVDCTISLYIQLPEDVPETVRKLHGAVVDILTDGKTVHV